MVNLVRFGNLIFCDFMLPSHLESILLVSGKPLTTRQLGRICSRGKEEVEVVVESLKEKYNREDSGIWILQNREEVQMGINPKNSELVKELAKEEINSELTRPQLETLTVIAYRGPISKLELETIRGVNCGLILRNLLIKGLIEVKEDKIIDNNIYNISLEFMKHLGITTVEDLPEYIKLNKREELAEVLNT